MESESGPASREQPNDVVIARTFDYENEATCDRHMHTFMKSISAAKASEGQGFAAVKVRLCSGALLASHGFVHPSFSVQHPSL